MLWTLLVPPTSNQTHTPHVDTDAHSFLHVASLCSQWTGARAHSVTHVHTHTQTHIDTHRWLCQPCMFTLGCCIFARVHVVPPVHIIYVHSRECSFMHRLTCPWTLKGSDLPTSRAGPGLDCWLGVPAGRLNWARLQPWDQRALVTRVCLSRCCLPALAVCWYWARYTQFPRGCPAS